ncbi:hypothetical protein LJC61_02565 [Ruminococcaceae bacterium OttesenSCG-928-A16]|nr:hypothetical protein [Ruminococcaceae bacterium OttesenSCG-928-A16]
MNEIFTYIINLPVSNKGQVRLLPDGDYAVFINSNLSVEQQIEAYNHEVRHIISGHYEQLERPIAAIEGEAKTEGLLADEIKQVSKTGLPLPPIEWPALPPQSTPIEDNATDRLDGMLGDLAAIAVDLESMLSDRMDRRERYKDLKLINEW